MHRKIIIFGIIILVASFIIKSVVGGLRNIEVDDFHPSATIFLIDASASNQNSLWKQKKFITQMCSVLDPEDQIKILKVSEDAYIIYEGGPHNGTTINKAMDAFTQLNNDDFGTAYGSAIKKAMGHALNMQKEGYDPAIVVMGDLENEGAPEGQINWETLPKNVERVKKYSPNLSMTFLFAHPSKLDFVKETLTPVLGESKLIVAPEENADKTIRKFMKAIGR